MAICPSCNAACLSTIPDTCIFWMGEDNTFFGIKQGDYYNDVMYNIVTKLQTILETQIDVPSNNDSLKITNTEKLGLIDAVKNISDKLTNLNSSDITVNSNLTGLSNESLSYDAGQLINRSGVFIVSNSTIGSSVGIDLSNAISNLPDNYSLSRTNVIILGKKKQGNTVITDSSLQVVNVNVENDRYPLDVQATVRVNTPNGTVDLFKNFVISTPLVGEFSFGLDVKDQSKTTGEQLNLTEFVNLISSQTRSNKSDLEQFKNLSIEGTQNIDLPVKDIRKIVPVLLQKLDESVTKVKTLSSVTYNSSETTPQAAVSSLEKTIEEINTKMNNLATDIKTLSDSISLLGTDTPTLLSQGGGTADCVNC